tara:strand:+ start:1524 stop:2015 length:492 start_codon:yes stop_codon:yes gene_type:complete
MLKRKFFAQLSAEVQAKYKKHIFDPAGGGKNAKDVFGKTYKEYKNSGDIDSYGQRKKRGVLADSAGKPQDEKFKNSKAPVLTGELMNSFDTSEVTNTGFGFGTLTNKGKAKHLDNMGRTITTNAKPVPDSVAKFIVDEMTKDVDDEFKKIRKSIKKKNINIKL